MTNADLHPLELTPEHVRKVTDPDSLGFATTEGMPPPARLVGQQVAQDSIDFALQMPDENYNLYVSGQSGSGRTTQVTQAVERAARQVHAPQDWCYVYHFDRPGEPMAISLPPGSAHTFAHDIEAFVIGCRRDLGHAFASEAYRSRRMETLRDVTTRRQQILEELQHEALSRGLLLEITPDEAAIIPLKPPQHAAQDAAQDAAQVAPGRRATASPQPPGEPEPMTPMEFDTLPSEEQQHIVAQQQIVQEAFAQAVPRIQTLEQEARDRLRALNHDIAQRAVDRMSESLLSRYAGHAAIAEYVRHMADDIVAHADVLRATSLDAARSEVARTSPPIAVDGVGPEAEQQDDGQDADRTLIAYEGGAERAPDGGSASRSALAVLLRRYAINVLVTHNADDHAPVVREINPTYFNLLGRIDFGLYHGLPYTDHLMVQPGAFHRANGGYLILQARDLFSHPLSWEAVKRVLRFGVIDTESSDELGNTPAGATLRPEPISVQVKVILIGDPATYTALSMLDPEFGELFKVRADFDSDMPRSAETERFYSQYAGDIAREDAGPPLTNDALARLIEEGSRWAGDQERLSTQLGSVQDLTIEACNLARREQSPVTTREHVARAIAARVRRLSLVSNKLDTLIQQGTILIDTSGAVVGQVNGLTVMSVAQYAFGKPARITARTSPGMAGIVDLERETLMSGPAHSKGILTLSGYLAGRFAQDYPLSLSGSICFEQVYGEIEGDSASSAELFALLSSLSGLPINQALAVTGSVDQRGVVQAVGGVNEKIEGFFTVCRTRGLTGEQGVLIPRANVRHLMLREDVVEAIRARQFHVYAINTIDEGIEILTGVPAGAALPDGAYPPDTVNGRVNRALRTFSQRVRAYGTPPLFDGHRRAGVGVGP